MQYNSVEEIKLHIRDQETLSSFKEVLSCYYSGNYRSAVVMLYVTVIMDIYYKYCYLADVYGNENASKFIKKIHERWTENSTSSEWEKTVRDQYVKEKYVSNQAHAFLKNLFDQRNLCAHPNNDFSKSIYQPNQYAVLGLILDSSCIICTSPLFTKDIFDIIEKDVIDNANLFQNFEQLEQYVETRYLSKIDDAQVEFDLFCIYWKLCLCSDSAEAVNNHSINRYLLFLLYKRNSEYFVRRVKSDYSILKDIKLIIDRCVLTAIKFFNYFDCSFSKLLPEESQNLFRDKVMQDENLKFISVFLHTLDYQYYDDAKLKFCNPSIRDVYKSYVLNLLRTKNFISYLDYIIDIFSLSSNYDMVGKIWLSHIYPYLNDFNSEQLQKILKVADGNDQIVYSYVFRKNYDEIKECLRKFVPDYDFSRFKKLEPVNS